MIFKSLAVGDIGANCYILGCPETKEGMVVDPGAESRRILAAAKELGVTVKYIVLTHGHLDHIGAVEEVRKETRAKVLIHELDADCLTDAKKNLSAFFALPVQGEPADTLLHDGEEIKVGSLSFKVLHTPGHTEGGICLSFPGGVISGDTLFAGSVGRTDFPGGSMEVLLDSIREKLLGLDPGTVVHPGHGPSSTIGEEKENNPFL